MSGEWDLSPTSFKINGAPGVLIVVIAPWIVVFAILYLIYKDKVVILADGTETEEPIAAWRSPGLIVAAIGIVLGLIFLIKALVWAQAHHLMTLSSATPRVEILDGIAGRPPPLFDAASGEYFDISPEADPIPSVVVLPPRDMRGHGVQAIVVDTGVLSDHPLLRDNLKNAVDFTGEGPEDRNGHGTAVSLILLKTAPDADLISVKCIGGSGEGDPKALVEALEWVAQSHAAPAIANISAGIDRRKWILFPCDGDCDVCRATKALAASGVRIVVAAGNRPGRTLCPARLSPKFVLSIGGADAVKPYNLGTINVDIPRYRAIPIVPRIDPLNAEATPTGS
jgi:subtilisin family serine protease